MSGDFERRLRAVERKLNGGTPPSIFRILTFEGGLPGPINRAYAGEHRWRREGDETLEQFTERAARAAEAAGETSLMVGGLPRSDELAEFESFDAWWATVAPFYSEVPPVEEHRFAPPRSRLGY
jgi:hypothetical protein